MASNNTPTNINNLSNFTVVFSLNFKTIIILDLLVYTWLIYDFINKEAIPNVEIFLQGIPDAMAMIYLLCILVAILNITFFTQLLNKFQRIKVKVFSSIMILISTLILAYFIFALLFEAYFL